MRSVCLVMGTLGRQGSPHILRRIEALCEQRNVECFVLLVSEINFE